MNLQVHRPKSVVFTEFGDRTTDAGIEMKELSEYHVKTSDYTVILISCPTVFS